MNHEQLKIGQALAELVRRLTPEEKREFANWLGWEELDVLRRNGRGKEHRVDSEGFAGFLDAHQEVLLEGSLMVELGDATLVSGGGGCMLLTLEGISGDLLRRLAREALQACGVHYEFIGGGFTAIVWDDELE